jgi:hypothetical protein
MNTIARTSGLVLAGLLSATAISQQPPSTGPQTAAQTASPKNCSKTYLLPRLPEADAMKWLLVFRKIAHESLGVLTVIHQFAPVGVKCRSNFGLHLIL